MLIDLLSQLQGDWPEQQYTSVSSLRHRQQYSQVFTPFAVAEFMAAWGLKVRGGVKKVLDPAAGLAVFARALKAQGAASLQITAYETDAQVLHRCQDVVDYLRPSMDFEFHAQDYLQSGWEATYDLILANPPYRNFRELTGREQRVEEWSEKLSVTLSPATNLYVFFLLKAVAQLRVGGRCAFLIPSDFLQQDYGEAVKQYLLRNGLQGIVAFAAEASLFAEVLTTSCIVLIEAGSVAETVEFITVNGMDGLQGINATLDCHNEQSPGVLRQRLALSALQPAHKWNDCFQIKTTVRLKHSTLFSRWARISRGIATGANDFFLLTQAKADALGLTASELEPVISKARHVKDFYFSEQHWCSSRDSGGEVYLLSPPAKHSPALMAYLQQGKAMGVHQCYLPRHRKHWYATEAIANAPILAGVFNRNGLRFVRNLTGFRHLTAFHGIYPLESGHDFMDLLMAYLLTPWARQLFQAQRREYGGGLVKFEPNDLSQAPVADFSALTENQQQKILVNFRSGLRFGIDVSYENKWLEEIDGVFRELMTD